MHWHIYHCYQILCYRLLTKTIVHNICNTHILQIKLFCPCFAFRWVTIQYRKAAGLGFGRNLVWDFPHCVKLLCRLAFSVCQTQVQTSNVHDKESNPVFVKIRQLFNIQMQKNMGGAALVAMRPLSLISRTGKWIFSFLKNHQKVNVTFLLHFCQMSRL